MLSCPDPDELDNLAQGLLKPEPDKFWDKDITEYAFSETRVRQQLERLMGTGIVRVTDRAYMQRLQQRIQEDHAARQRQRIADREAEEIEREMDLVLKGEIPADEAPEELADHPVLVNAQIIKKISEQKLPKRKKRRRLVPERCFYPAPATAAEEEEKMLGAGEPPLLTDVRRTSADQQQQQRVLREDPEEAPGSQGYMLSPEEYEKLKYESPLIKQLRQVESVEELYRLAEEIVGLHKTSRTDG